MTDAIKMIAVLEKKLSNAIEEKAMIRSRLIREEERTAALQSKYETAVGRVEYLEDTIKRLLNDIDGEYFWDTGSRAIARRALEAA